MNHTNTNNRLLPKSVITVYADKNNTSYYLDQREVKVVAGKNVLMAPVPLGDNVFRGISGCYAKANPDHLDFDGVISEHLLYGINKAGKTVVAWYRPAVQRALNFSGSLKIRGANSVHIPATLYLVINTKLYMYALAGDERPSLTTKLHNAPFFNIYEDGNVCLGSANVGRKAKTFEKEAERFENGFYMAEQNHGHIVNCKTPLAKLWPALIKSKAPFPVKELVQHKKYKTFGELIKILIGNVNTDQDED